MEYIINDCLDPYFNLALEEYLFHTEDRNMYFWLWQNDNTVVIGKNQNAFQEVDHDFLQKNHIKLARRMTGGGAVYHDLGNLNFSFIVPANNKRDYDFKRFTDIIAKALQALGIQAEYSGRNDLLINGKKFSGNAQFVGKEKILHHGTLLFSADLAMIEKCLTPSLEKLAAHGVGSVKSRVTTIAEHLPAIISLAEFKEKLAAHIFAAYDSVNMRELTQEEVQAVHDLRAKKFAAYEWNYGASPEFNRSKTKRFAGCGSINLSMNVKAGIIETCRLTGDFFGSGDVSELEQLLKNKACAQEQILAAIAPLDLGYYFGSLSHEDFLELFDFEA